MSEARASASNQEIELWQELLQWPAPKPSWWSLLAGARNDLALIRVQQGDHARARAQLEQAVEEQGRALEASPSNPGFERHMVTHLFNLCISLRALGEPELAARSVERVEEYAGGNPQAPFHAASQLARIASDDDSGLFDDFAARSLRLLRLAKERAGVDAAQLRESQEFEELRGLPDFDALLAD